MVWTQAPESDLAMLIEVMAIGLVTTTCALALYTEFRVYKRRHGHGEAHAKGHHKHGKGHHKHKHGGKREQEFDVDDNPLFDAKDLITVTFSKPGPLDMRFEQVDGVDGGDGSACAIKLVELGAEVKEQQPDLAPGLFLREVVGHDISGLDLETVLPLISEVQEGAGLSLVFSREESTLGGTVVAAANAMDRVGQIHASLSVTSLVRDAL